MMFNKNLFFIFLLCGQVLSGGVHSLIQYDQCVSETDLPMTIHAVHNGTVTKYSLSRLAPLSADTKNIKTALHHDPEFIRKVLSLLSEMGVCMEDLDLECMMTFIVIEQDESGKISEIQLNLNYSNRLFNIPSKFGSINIDMQFADLCLNRKRRINGSMPIGCTSSDLISLVFGHPFVLVCDIIDPLCYSDANTLASNLESLFKRFIEYMQVHRSKSDKNTAKTFPRTKPISTAAKILCEIRRLYSAFNDTLGNSSSSSGDSPIKLELAFNVLKPEVL